MLTGVGRLSRPGETIAPARQEVAVSDSAPTTQNRGEVTRLWLVAGVCAILLLFVGITGGYQSPLLGLLFLPVFFAAIAFGPRGSVLTASGVALGLFLCGLLERPFPVGTAVLQTVVLLIVALSAGVFAERMLRAVQAANQRTRRVEQRAAELEWLTDTVAMMESLHDMESMLSVLLLRLGDVVRCDWAAIYLRSSDDPRMDLAQSLGLDPRATRLRVLSPAEQSFFQGPMLRCWRWSRGEKDSTIPPGPFARLDPGVEALLIVPLRSTEEVFGVLVLGARTREAFGDRDCERLTRLGGHIVYPIQRVRLQAMATTDALTGLNNRRAFFHKLSDEVQRTRRYHRPLSLVMLDIDHFKQINDTQGHLAGDAALAHLGGLLLRMTRATDFVARVGGEEIAILCLETPGEEAQKLAERIRKAVEAAVIPTDANKPESVVRMTISLGIAALPADADDAESLFRQADKALYRAKGSGRNRVCVAGQEEEEFPLPAALTDPTVPRKL